MTWWDAAFLALAGVVGGLTGSIAGLASVATYPALLLVGLPPVTANVTNTVALVFNGIGSVWGSRPELKGQAGLAEADLPAAAVGGATGRAAVVHACRGFEKIVPILLGSFGRHRASARRQSRKRESLSSPAFTDTPCSIVVAIFLICIYGGFFGAAAGVLMIALLLRPGMRRWPTPTPPRT